MGKATKEKEREIIDDFVEEIKHKRTNTAKPENEVIDFRNDRVNNFEREVWEVPLEILRFRKDNGRIASDVLSYEKNYALLSETDIEDQNILGKFLYEKDVQKTEELKNSLFHGGQRDPAIITCDGFLINGNRRKLALEQLNEKYPEDGKFRSMKVVILPGKEKNGGGPPTLKEIEQIENRYQLQSDGKAEYYNFDRALSIRRKIELGISLDDQLRDDPNFVNLSNREFEKEKKKIESEYLGPLECVDNYLNNLGREEMYDTVSKSRGDKKGRWQAFIEYHKVVYKKLLDENKRIEMGIKEDEIGKIEDTIFKIIRTQDIPGCRSVYMLVRDFPRLLAQEDAKKEIMKIAEINPDLTEAECYDKDGKEYDPRMIDTMWRGKHISEIVMHIKKAQGIVAYAIQAETPLTLLEASLKKLNHEKMNLKAIQTQDTDKAKELIHDIRNKIKDLDGEFYRLQKIRK